MMHGTLQILEDSSEHFNISRVNCLGSNIMRARHDMNMVLEVLNPCIRSNCILQICPVEIC
jgi:hypothetical protein